jgi:hypothetical protein
MNDYKLLIILAIIGCVGFLVYYLTQKKRNFLFKNGIEVDGIVKDIVVEALDDGIKTKVKYPYVHFLTKDNLLIEDKSCSSGDFTIGQSVKVFYNPINPKEFVIK